MPTENEFYKINNVEKQNVCYAVLNSYCSNNKFQNTGIVLKKEQLSYFNEEDRNIFLNNIKKIDSVVNFKIENKKNVFIEFNYKKEYKRGNFVMTSMIIRMLYQTNSDNFTDIAKYFIDLCKNFKRKDRGLLLTTACNLYLANKSNKTLYNYNHTLMNYSGCEILNNSEIKEKLKNNAYINEIFSKSEDKYNRSSYNDDFLKNYILKNNSKKEYLRIFRKNGIKLKQK